MPDTNPIPRLEPNPIVRSEGVTETERYLKRLCDRSFLSLWSYSGVFRDQGRTDGKGDGKEVADLLVVFENHIIIVLTTLDTVSDFVAYLSKKEAALTGNIVVSAAGEEELLAEYVAHINMVITISFFQRSLTSFFFPKVAGLSFWRVPKERHN
jgi:hypothetical protein